MSLRVTIAKGFGHNTAGAVLGQVISFVRTIILARLLLPADFGLFGIAVMTIAATDVLLNLKLNISIIPRAFRDEGEQKRWLDTVWSLELVRSGIVFLISCGLAWPVSIYFGDSRILPILIAASLATLLAGFNNVGMTLHQRDVNFREVVIWELLASFFTLVVTVGLAYMLRSAMALAWGLVAGALFKIVLSYVLHPYRPSWAIDREALRESVRFGINLLIIGVLTYVTTQFDNFVVGKILGASILGVYLLAYQLAMMPVMLLGNIMNRTMFPVYSRVLRENAARGFELWALSLKYSIWLLLLICVPLWAEREQLIPWLYGQRWAAAAAPFGILIFAGLFRGLTQVSSAMLLGLGLPQVDAKAKFVETVVFVTLVLALVKPFGMMGAASAGIGCYVLAFVLRTVSVARRGTGLGRQFLSFVPGLTLGFLVGMGAGWGLRLLGAPLFVGLPGVALAIALCGLILEGSRVRSVLGVCREILQGA